MKRLSIKADDMSMYSPSKKAFYAARTVRDKRLNTASAHNNREFWGQNSFRHSHSAMVHNGTHSVSWELNYIYHWAKCMKSFWRI